MRYLKKHLKKHLLLAALLLSAGVTYQQTNAGNHPAKRANGEYRQALKFFWTSVYARQGNTLYCDKRFSTKNYKERKQYVNAEHVFPMSWVTKDLHCGTRKACQKHSAAFRTIESDLHNIYPALIKVNKARSSYRFGDVKGEKRRFGSCDFEVDKKRRIAEPSPAVRGEVARAMLYMQYQYGLTLHKKTKALMLAWDKADPPGKEEKRRAKIIQAEQGRENPFISRYPFTPR